MIPLYLPISPYISLYLAISRFISLKRLASAACTMAGWKKRPKAMLTCREMWGDIGGYREIWGDVGRCRQAEGDAHLVRVR